jgi:hypothetical protein
VKYLLVLLLLFAPWNLLADQLHVLIGPPSLGQGGSNPVSIPPFNPVDWQVTYVTAENREWLVSLVPGLIYGQRFQAKGLYAALGGGLLVNTTGLGLGVSHAYGFESGAFLQRFRYQIEYRQIIGVGNYGWKFPYSFRMGVSYAL